MTGTVMPAYIHRASCLLVCTLAVAVTPRLSSAQPAPGMASVPAPRDGQRDFDFEIGNWKTHLRRLVHPLTGSTTWAEYEGTSVVRRIWNGRANLVELEVDGPAGHVEALSLRLYDPQSHQWSLNSASSRGGGLGQPTIGEFRDGRGEFFDQEAYNGRAILVRNVWSDITPTSCRFEQAFSNDGGKSWEVNWIAVDTRVSGDSSGRAARTDARDSSPPSRTDRETLGDAWWTGPMLAASGGTLPHGHFLFEPYLYDVTAAHANGLGSLSYVNYGLTDRLTVGSIPTFGFNEVPGGPNSSGIGIGDVTALAQFRLTQFQPGGWVPTASVVLEETFPTGRYDRLGDRPSDGLGSGAYTTTVGLYSQTYFWMPNGRILRTRLDLSQTIASDANVEDVSVYGTAAGFRGHANPGGSLYADVAAEYSVTRNWVLALDLPYRHNASTRVTGSEISLPGGTLDASTISFSSGRSDVFGAAPAIEYNWKSTIGVLLGTRVLAGTHTTTSVTPAVAINIVR
jgi:hypothetical protein